MPTADEIVNEINNINPYKVVRDKYLKKLHSKRDRNVIAYYSGWLTKPGTAFTSIIDVDKNGFMNCVNKMDCSKGLDLILHSPGGDVAAIETIIHYLRQKFGSNIETFVPQLSMSGGTMMALIGNKIHMGKQSNLGPIDPQYGGRPAVAILKEFNKAVEEILEDERMVAVYAAFLQQLPPGFIEQCRRAMDWSKSIGRTALMDGMFKRSNDREALSKRIVEALTTDDEVFAHNLHIHTDDLKNKGVKVAYLEKDDELQDIVLSIHHAFMTSVSNTKAAKLIESHHGKGFCLEIEPPT